MPPVQELTVARPTAAALDLPRVPARGRVALAVLGLTAISFLFPSAPTYDPWSWIIWGREVLHLDLSTVNGPSWKPLPVLLTTPFALFGSLAPDLWLFVARAGTIAGVVAVFGLARRLGGLPAGAAAAAAYAMAPWTIRNGALGNSEGLLVALAVAAVDRHLAGRPRAAFLLGLGAALLRPEVWPFLGLYGLWLLWRHASERILVVAGFASLPVLWLLPELWGSGDLLRAAHRAKIPNANSAAFADDPIRAVLDQFTAMLTPALWAGVAALVVVAVARRAPGRSELRAVGALAVAVIVLVGEVAYMTSDGFSGNTRYLILPAALLCVLAGVGVGWAVRAVSARVAIAATGGLVLSGVAAVAFALPSVNRLEPTLQSLRYQAQLTDGLPTAIAAAGGRERLLACGAPYTGPFQVPAVAWQLHLPVEAVQLDPRAPAVVFRSRNTSRARPLPALDGVGGEAAVRTLAIDGSWRIVGRCR